MRREAPKPALSYTDGLKPKRYATKQAAYYAIAKRLVVAKYPPMLANEYVQRNPIELGDDWTEELVERRMAKMFALFYVEDREAYFDERRWRRFITRVAKFLAFVDSKRTPAELNELRFGADGDPKRVQAEYEAAERAVDAWAQRAKELRDYIAAKANR